VRFTVECNILREIMSVREVITKMATKVKTHRTGIDDEYAKMSMLSKLSVMESQDL
jgi:hypothetical protein